MYANHYESGRHPAGPRIRAARLALGISQTELAKRAGVSGAQISYMEAGRHRSRFIVEIAVALDVDPRWLALGIGKAPLLTPFKELRRQPFRVVGEDEPRRKMTAAEEAHRIWSRADIRNWDRAANRKRA